MTGAVIDNKLALTDHLAEKIYKINRIVGLSRRKFVILEPKIFKSLHAVLFRSHLGYANQIWNLHLVGILKLWRMQTAEQ